MLVFSILLAITDDHNNEWNNHIDTNASEENFVQFFHTIGKFATHYNNTINKYGIISASSHNFK